MSESVDNSEYIRITADIVSAFVGNNAVRTSELPTLIDTVHATLLKATETKAAEPVSVSKPPAVSVKKSITDEYLICLEDGKKFKSLKRHLSTAFNMSPDDYRAKWGLGREYPMVAPAYASARSSLARQMGLGRKREGADRATADVVSMNHHVNDETIALESQAPRKRGRPRIKNAA